MIRLTLTIVELEYLRQLVDAEDSFEDESRHLEGEDCDDVRASTLEKLILAGR